ncbi:MULTISPECIES: hypothetical protein [unclassified Blastococcus]
MLALTPEPLQTAGERAVFAELARWDTGGAVRAAVVASLPMVDGPMGRRISDAVLFVPEGLAVVRIAEVPKQTGVVTAVPEGAWSIAPDARPGEVLQIAGGGSSPLDGLMRSGMEAAVRLRQAGLEPGRIARLTVLVGDLTGLVPADGDLGEGDQVALLESRSLLLGIARSARYAGIDNPRLWTTADVRSALEVLGLPGRGPSVEELNGEGFPYSPYVLRRRELLAPAAMHASAAMAPPPAAAPAAAPHVPPVTGGFVAPTPGGPRVDPAAAAAVAAAAIRADEAAAAHRASVAAAAQQAAVPAAPQALAPAPQPVTPAPQAVASAWEAPQPLAPAAPPQPVSARGATAASAWGQQAWAAPAPTWDAPQPAPAPAEPAADETDGIGGLFGRPETTDPGSRALPATLVAPAVSAPAVSAPAVPAPEPGRPLLERPQSEWPQSEWRSAERPAGTPLVVARRRPDRTRRLLLLAGALVLVIAVVVVGLVAVLGGGDDDADRGTTAGPAPTTSAPTQEQGLQTGDTAQRDGLTFTLQRLEEDGSCAAHAYGAVADFFADTDCAGLARALYSTEVDGNAVVVAISTVDMGDEAGADALRVLADTNGSGNVSDLLREGVRYPGGPAELSRAEYASAVDGTVVTIVETAWAGPGRGSTSDLDVVAGTALSLPMPDPAA